jgi:glycosyltransferase involved in cell wall biosynthesis
MQDSDLLVLSSNYEGFGNVIVEALYCGLKIVSTDCISGPREILNNGEFGSLVPVNDSEAFANAIIYELNYQRSIENQKNRAYNFLPSKIAMDLNSLICTL